ncbi:unnamed protein product [Echinostoma caproni]|uniref:valine--tRNA ligase n=1 Tax=Echinostoma caproni TaxID=27848 RepID=A0A183APL1_9TREM|nr:unnamed protein product [Echinostoma caproni]
MSKSKGNVVDPLDLIHGVGTLPKHLIGSNIQSIGADALRASLLSCTLDQSQVAYNPELAVEMRRFCNKIWQTARFALLRLQADQEGALQSLVQSLDLAKLWSQVESIYESTHLVDRWLIHRLANIVQLIHDTWSEQSSMDNTDSASAYVFHPAIQQLHYWWTEELCSVYLEVIKYREKTRPSTDLSVFLLSMLTGLHMLHPIMPHVTESIWQGLRHASNSSHLSDSSQPQPETCLALQPFPNPDWFQFTNKSNWDHERLTVSKLLSSATQTNSWRAVLRLRSSARQTDRNPKPTLQLITSEHTVDQEELMCALTRLTAYDLDWTQSELERRLNAHIKRRDQFTGQLKSRSDSDPEPNRAALQKVNLIVLDY